MCVELEEAKANRGCFKEMHQDIIVNWCSTWKAICL
jgi:hypothetical protein